MIGTKFLTRLIRLQRHRWKAQADEDAAENLLADLLGETETEVEKEEKEPPTDKPAGE